jgi:putative FmdB family regulatory protein
VPVYAFICESCGPFELVRPMSESGAEAACASCGAEAVRRALDVEEKSAHEPDVVTEKHGRPLPHGHTPAPPWVLSH